MSRLGRPKKQLVLTPEERGLLLQWSHARRQRAAALRARIILACGDGASNREVAGRFRLAEHTVGKWRRRFVAGRLEGLRDRRSDTRGRRRTLTPAVSHPCELARALASGAPFGPWSLGEALRGPQLLPAPAATGNGQRLWAN